MYDAARRSYALTLGQSCAATPGQTAKLPFHIPFSVGLVDARGADVPLRLQGETAPTGTTRVLSLSEPHQRFVFVDVPSEPVPSLLRSFSAPVIVRYEYTDEALTHLLAHDSNDFNRWEAGQRLALKILLRGVAAHQGGQQPEFSDGFVRAFARVLDDAARDPAFTAEALALPSETYIAEQMNVADPDAVHAVRVALRRRLAHELKGELLAAYQAFAVAGPYSPDARSAGQRALKNLCLSYLMELPEPPALELCTRQFETADNMTDAMAALTALANTDCAERGSALAKFYSRWSEEPLVVDKWLAVQASSRLPGTLAEVKRLTAHPAFDIKNPNKVYALIRSFGANQVRFHAADGEGYAFLAGQIIALDALNPQIAARIARSFDRWRKFDPQRQQHAHTHLERVRAVQGLSKDTLEVVSKALA